MVAPQRRSLLRALAPLGVLLGTSWAAAQALPLPEGARSYEITSAGVTVRAAPSTRAPRRGTVRVGTRLPVHERVRGQGCPGGEWIRVGDEAFVCETLGRPSRAEPSTEVVPVVPEGALLPRRYAFVAADGTWAYRRPSDYFADDWNESLGAGFGVAVVQRSVERGVPFVRSLAGSWIPESDVRYAAGSAFRGVELDGALDVAWVARDGAAVRAWDGRRAGAQLRRAGRREVVRIEEELPGGLLRIADGVIAARDVIRPREAPPPAGAREDEVWIDVQLSTQTLLVWRGARPVFATLVSTGRAGPSHRTPTGEFRIWVKLAEDTMDDLQRVDQETNYAIEGVPWVQYFAGGVGLHAAFWHDQFGTRRSHGCVNLAPADAQRIFAMTSPRLPPGWDAILPTEAQPGTIVRVRD